MARTKEVTVYKFEELSPKAKGVVRYWVNDNSWAWWDSIYDDFMQVAAQFGFEIGTSSRTTSRGHVVREQHIWFEQRYGWTAGFNARFRLLDAVQAEQRIKEYAPKDELLHRMAKVMCVDIAKFAIVGLRHIIEQGDLWMDIKGDETGVNQDAEFTFNDPDVEENMTPEQKTALLELQVTVLATATDLARWLARTLDAENDYRHSDDAVQEHCEANEYEFYEDGSVA